MSSTPERKSNFVKKSEKFWVSRDLSNFGRLDHLFFSSSVPTYTYDILGILSVLSMGTGISDGTHNPSPHLSCIRIVNLELCEACGSLKPSIVYCGSTSVDTCLAG